MSRPRLSVALPSFGAAPGDDWRALTELARQAERAGIDRVVVSDHVVMGRHTENYRWGKFPVPPEAPWMEPLTVLTAMAAVTERIRLSTGILIAPLRTAAVLAKTVATIDQLSRGRLDLGVGTGWQREEYEAAGLDFSRRGSLLTDTMAACRALWAPGEADFESDSLSFQGILCDPKPYQERLPVWFSGPLTSRTLERIVALGDGWIPIMGATLEEIADGVRRLRQALAERGRDPSGLRVQAPPLLVRGDDGRPDLDATLASVPELVGAGVTEVQVPWALSGRRLSDAPEALERLGAAFTRACGR